MLTAEQMIKLRGLELAIRNLDEILRQQIKAFEVMGIEGESLTGVVKYLDRCNTIIEECHKSTEESESCTASEA